MNEDKLRVTVEQAAQIRDLCEHPGFKLLRKSLEDKLASYHKQWLAASDEEASKMRYRTQGFNVVLDEVKSFLLAGEVSRRTLQNN
jgi:hypothetical protein